MRCDFQKSECHFQSRSCSLYFFKATDKIVHIPYVGGRGKNHYCTILCVCVFVFTWQEGPANTISSSRKIYVTQNLELGGPVVLLPSQHAQTHRHLWSRTSPWTSFFHDKQNYFLSVLFGKALVRLFSLPCAKLQN